MANAISVIIGSTNDQIKEEIVSALVSDKIKEEVENWNFWFENDSNMFIRTYVSFNKIHVKFMLVDDHLEKEFSEMSVDRGTPEYEDVLKVCRGFCSEIPCSY